MSNFKVGDIVECRVTATWFGGANGINAALLTDPPYNTGFRIQAEEMLPEYVHNLSHGQIIKLKVFQILYDCPFFSMVLEEENQEDRKTRIAKMKKLLREAEKDAEDKRWGRGKYSKSLNPKKEEAYRPRTDWAEERRIEEQIREDAWEYNENH